MNINKIILSLAVIGVVSAIAVGGTIAYFSDTETSTGNTFSAGSIDIAVDNENPWSSDEAYTFSNLMPGDSKDMNVTLKNVGANPVVVWKKVSVSKVETGSLNEPECSAENGKWDGTNCSEETPIDDVDTQFVYSMKIAGGDNIKKEWDVRVSDINDIWIPVGRLEIDEEVTVEQNYYFNETAGNVYQGDEMTLDITFYAEQIDVAGPAYVERSNGVVLDNKNPAYEWAPVVGDGVWGILTWDDTGDYRIRAWGLQGTDYRIRAWDYNTDTEVAYLSSVKYNDTNIDDTGSYVNFDKTNTKYWLQTVDDSLTLWESNLVNN